ncbi:MAG: phosphoribosylformylglycinamidine synthase subunit PurL [Candidatus Eisenbacteria bacterium]|nr:phosphoribosylformylglycinamidine synthase subunit PurL [Candidatus Eisenbacteria bacterium]
MPSSSGSSAELQARVTGLDDAALERSLRGRGLNLKLHEARRLASELGRDPSWAELFLFDAMWSEHCSYKSTRHLLKRYLPTGAPHVILGPGEDSGVIRVDTNDGPYAVVMAHESHNHPSQVLPHEGAATGVGGILRDVACMGAEVVGVMDGLRFGDLDGPNAARVREVARGVVEGVAHYGDAVGVPNLGGDAEFSPVFDENVLVNVVSLGVCREGEIVRSRVPAAARREPYELVLVGKPTDSSGLGGASFASVTLTGEAESMGAVQLPDPFLKRVLLVAQAEVLKRAREAGLEIGYKDLGAGGIGCAGSEIAAAGGFGVELDFDRETLVPPGLASEFALVAETQERFAWAVPASFAPEVLRIYNEQYSLPELYPGAGARVLGRFEGHGRFVVRRAGQVVVDVPNELITAGISVRHPAKRRPPLPPVTMEALPAALADPAALLKRWAASRRGASRRPLFRFYDSEVQGRAVLRAGEADAGVFLLRWGGPEAVAVTVDGDPGRLEADPAGGAAAAVCEVARNLVAAGAAPRALTDCLNFGNPEHPEVMGDLEEALRGLGEAARAVGSEWEGGAFTALPYISGNVSLYNQRSGGRNITPTPIVAGVGVLADLGRATTPRLKTAGDVLVFLGRRRGMFSGSWAAAEAGLPERGALPAPSEAGAQARAEITLVLAGIGEGRISAAHDVAEGGVLWTAFEMCLPFASERCMGLDMSAPYESWMLEEGCGFLLEMAPSALPVLARQAAAAGLEAFEVARVTATGRIRFATSRDADVKALAALRADGLGDIFP